MLDGAPSVTGVWTARAAHHYVLAAPVLHQDEGETYNLEGELWIPRERVLYVQVVG